ncbi:MAG TPA: amino acid permease, partial [Ktedonobacteraceae bacterium]
WPLITVFVVIVALGMAELASAYPTAGGLYYWASKLGGPGWGWFTGWFNLIGQVAVTAGIDYGAAVSVDALLNAWFPAVPAVPGFADPATQWATLLIYACVLALHATLNIFGVRIVAFLNDVSVWWHIGGVILIGGGVVVAALLGFQFTAASHFATSVAHAAPLNSAGTLFTPNQAFNATGGTNGVGAFPLWYAFLLGLLLAQYTYTGYDASAHMTEETIGAETRAPWGVVMSVVVSAFAGYAVLMGLIAAVPDLAAANTNTLSPVLGILLIRLGYVLGTLSFAVAVIAQLFCGMSSVTSNSRMIYAFSRDGAVPFHDLWHRLDSGRTPRNAILLSVTGAFILAIPTVWNYTAYAAITSIATIGLYIAYALPIFLRIRSKDFQPGPWHLGAWSKPIGWIAVIWVVFIAILFMLPTINPTAPGVNVAATFNYTPIVVLGTFLLIGLWWLLSARNWFKGPVIQGSAAELAAIERSVGETVVVEGIEGANAD